MKKIVLVGLLILLSTHIFAQQKDTLFFQFSDYLQEDNGFPNFYFLKNERKNGEEFLFKQDTIYNDLEPEKIFCIEKYIKNSEFYNEKKYRRIYAYGLYEHLREYIVFLVKKENNKNIYIKVFPLAMIE